MDQHPAPAPAVPPAPTTIPGAVWGGLALAGFAKVVSTGLSINLMTSSGNDRTSSVSAVGLMTIVQVIALLVAAFGLLSMAARRDGDRVEAAAALVAAAVLIVAAI